MGQNKSTLREPPSSSDLNALSSIVPNPPVNNENPRKSSENVLPSKRAIANTKMSLQTQDIAAQTNRECETVRKSEKNAIFAKICSKIKPYLFVSGELIASNREILKENNIQYVINCAKEAVPNFFPDQLEYYSLALRDGCSEEISPFFLLVIDQIEKWKTKGNGNILIHCHQGVSRSCAMGIAYIMWSDKISFHDAFDQVKSLRGVCSPNSGFICQLLEFEKELSISLRTSSQSVLYNVAPHATYDVDQLLLKKCLNENTRTPMDVDPVNFNSNGCFVVLKSSRKAFIWIGSGCTNDQLVKIANYFASLIFKYQFSLTEDNYNIEVLKQGEETNEFKNIAGDGTSFAVGSNATTNVACSQSHLETRETLDSDGDKPSVYIITSLNNQWESLSEYDDGDLTSDALILIKLSKPYEIHGYYLWIGEDYFLKENELLNYARKIFPTLKVAEICYIKQNDETDAFWEVFEAGY